MANEDLLNILQQLTGQTQDLGGGPREDDARALSQLILGGGRASVGSTPIFGGPAPDPQEIAATQAAMGGFGRVPDPGLAKAIQEGRVDPNALLDRPFSAPTRKELVQTAPGVQVVKDVRQGEPDIPLQPAGTFSGRNVVPLNPTLARISDTALQVADSLTPSRASTVDKVLLPNPYGPGSYDPRDPDAVAKIKEQGEKAAKISNVRDLLSGDFLSRLPPGTPVKDIVSSLLESTGLIKSEAEKTREIAQAKAEGERAGGKGIKEALPQDLVASAGTPQFLEKMAEAMASGAINDPNKQLALEKLHDARVKQRTPEEKQALGFANAQSSVKRLDKVADLYENAVKEGKGISKNLKLALAKNSTFASFLQNKTIPLTKSLTDAEASYVAEVNSLLIGMRQLYDDQRMSDQDVKNALQALGNPATGPDLYRKQLAATKGVIQRRGEDILTALQARGKDVSGLTSTAPAPAAAAEGTLPDGRRWRNVGGKIQVEDK